MNDKRQIVARIVIVFAIILALLIGVSMTMFENPGAVNEALSIQAGSTTTGDGPFIYKSKYTADGKPSDEGLSKLIADEMEFCKRELQEGSVLLENNGALPLKENERRVSLFAVPALTSFIVVAQAVPVRILPVKSIGKKQ